jgi:hypothetical protein
MSTRRPQQNQHSEPFRLSPRALVGLLLLAVLITTVVAIMFTDIRGSSDDDERDTTEVLARTGCLDVDIIPLPDPPQSLFEAEASVRQQLEDIGQIRGVDSDDEFEPGDLLWADYGELAPGSSGRIYSGEAWIMVFEDTRHESGFDRFINRRIDARFSVVYRPDTGQITAACGGEV